jgi:hypothetical protein
METPGWGTPGPAASDEVTTKRARTLELGLQLVDVLGSLS